MNEKIPPSRVLCSPNINSDKELGKSPSCECEKVCEVAQVDMGDKALSGGATHVFFLPILLKMNRFLNLKKIRNFHQNTCNWNFDLVECRAE